MKNKAKKNNKGFSLVELIVVVLIIGVIAVALAPQVMKWVGESKTNTDNNNAATLKSIVQSALAEWQKDGGSIPASDDAVYYIHTDKTLKIHNSSDWTKDGEKLLSDYINTAAGADYTLPNSKATFVITVEAKTGKVTVEPDDVPAVPAPPET